jgi:isocitrate dehydrogenase
MKMTDGLFHHVFDEVAAEYPDIENEHWIADIGAAKMADTPEAFDVIVLPNLYGEFADAVITRIGEQPTTLKAAAYAEPPPIEVKVTSRAPQAKLRVGVDVFLGIGDITPDDLAAELVGLGGPMKLDMLSNRGQKVWPEGLPETLLVDSWRCRFLGVDGATITGEDMVALLGRVTAAGLDVIKTEGLHTFDGVAGFTKGQGQ